MRIFVDRAGDAVRLALSEAGVAETRALREGIAAELDAQGRLVGVTIAAAAQASGAPDALAEVRVDLSGAAMLAARPTPAARPISVPPLSPPRPVTAAERAALGPLTWTPEAEAAIARVPFFERGARRRAVVDLARARGISEVSAALVAETGGRRG